MGKLGATMDDRGRGVVFCDDGAGAHLRVLGPEGNGDFYLEIYEPERLPCSIRCCTSGGKQPAWFMRAVAAIWYGLSGKQDRAAQLFRDAAAEVEILPTPQPSEGE